MFLHYAVKAKICQNKVNNLIISEQYTYTGYEIIGV